ncbi:hypothetical protein Deipr_1888 [Deinococcus proteolyticus MRP]|uniref:Uncharacterized protein n=1 Tax=Deinococcus proteolyticus (strain ATCC 35074 / DSM 20540 / JCM 6276 / NBRC 101906 / NCIMB 13154 / VKM Ac-1939 / CCM 2703 / MRP) TaxID=693977 RepID=F0RM10_DEIPM|nr:hypothetical protein Deipr_1888 [Deinococcus proteolyticus MRP]
MLCMEFLLVGLLTVTFLVVAALQPRLETEAAASDPAE